MTALINNNSPRYPNEVIISQREIQASLEYYDGNTNDLRLVFNEAVTQPLIERTSEIDGRRCTYHITASGEITRPVFDTSSGSAIVALLTMLAYLLACLLIILL